MLLSPFLFVKNVKLNVCELDNYITLRNNHKYKVCWYQRQI